MDINISSNIKWVAPISDNERKDWEKRRLRKLKPVRTLTMWNDVCGIGRLLKQTKWNLDTPIAADIIRVLGRCHDIGAWHKWWTDPDHLTEKILVLNDGIVTSLDVPETATVQLPNLCEYLKHLFMVHFRLYQYLREEKLSVRTVISAGERVQYVPEFGGTRENFVERAPDVYYPAHFQMNTAFSRAYIIDSLGRKNGVCCGNMYLDSSVLTLFKELDKRVHICQTTDKDHIRRDANLIKFTYGKIPYFDIELGEELPIQTKILKTRIFKVQSTIAHLAMGEGMCFRLPLTSCEIDHFFRTAKYDKNGMITNFDDLDQRCCFW